MKKQTGSRASTICLLVVAACGGNREPSIAGARVTRASASASARAPAPLASILTAADSLAEPAPEAALAEQNGALEIQGHELRTTLDKRIDEVVLHGSARFAIENRGASLRRVWPFEVRLIHPRGCAPPARNPRSNLPVQDVWIIEHDDEILVPRELELAPGANVEFDVVFQPVQGHPKTCANTTFRVVFTIDRKDELTAEASWVIEHR